MIDTSSVSSLFETGVTSGEYTHTPIGTPRAVAIGAFGWEKNAVDVSSLSYGGDALTEVEGNITGTAPNPSVAWWFKDNVKAGAQPVVVGKNTSAKVRLVTVTILAGGEVTVIAHEGGSSAGSTSCNIAKLEAGVRALALGGHFSNNANKYTAKSHTALREEDEGALYWLVQYSELESGGSATFTTTWSESKPNARTGLILGVPAEVESPAIHRMALLGVGQ